MALFFKKRIYVKLSPEAQELLEIYKLSAEERRKKYLDTFNKRDLDLAALWFKNGVRQYGAKVSPYGKGHVRDLIKIIFEKDQITGGPRTGRLENPSDEERIQKKIIAKFVDDEGKTIAECK